ncbi:leucine-rich repeat protein 1-like [Tropilaelaps mercedesae]|uniref:Leucine-rich repeat protein 1-like n=1 Tax=Tropilaelaps mercedesae TaxID=418985 RepID=A0A1V9XMF1_9ACAR|nr:leucine-rich repeat protein 1-like [Tropilaelaps mercedesae]
MRLTCDAHLTYRKTGGGRRLGQAVITITPNIKKKSEYNLVITTRKNEAGFIYRNVRSNIKKMFTSCVREGKLTISLKEPEHDVLIRMATVVQLENFIKVLQAAQKGLELPNKLTIQPPTKIKPKVTRMEISQRGDYPIRGFPMELRTLRILNIKLTRLQNKVLDLANLVDLVVENNLLEEVPKALASMSLNTLSLQGNKIKRVYDIFSGTLGSTIKVLNLSHNEITQIPYSLCRTKLHVLDLSYNQLETLPPSFHGGEQMTVLKINNNRIRYLPANLCIRTAEVTLRANSDLFETVQQSKPTPGAMTLLDFAGRAVHQAFCVSRVNVDKAIPQILYPYLLSFVPCGGCGRLTFPSPQRRTLRHVHVLDFAASLVSEIGENGMVRKADIRCCPKCARSL